MMIFRQEPRETEEFTLFSPTTILVYSYSYRRATLLVLLHTRRLLLRQMMPQCRNFLSSFFPFVFFFVFWGVFFFLFPRCHNGRVRFLHNRYFSPQASGSRYFYLPSPFSSMKWNVIVGLVSLYFGWYVCVLVATAFWSFLRIDKCMPPVKCRYRLLQY